MNACDVVFRQYTIWFSLKTPVDTVSLAMTSPRNTTFYQAMIQASDIDQRFAFEAHEWPNGHYIHTIGGHTEDLTKFNYWLLYKLPDIPDPKKSPENKFINSVSGIMFCVNNIQKKIKILLLKSFSNLITGWCR